MTKHTVKLAHGYRIEARTKLVNREDRVVNVYADIYQNGTLLKQRTLSLRGVRTNGELIDKRNSWFDQIQRELGA